MILKAGDPVLNLPACEVAFLGVVLPSAGPIRVAQPLTRAGRSDFVALKAHHTHPLSGSVTGVPLYWAPTTDGAVEVYPVPDADYTIQARNTRGNDMVGSKTRHDPPRTQEIIGAFRKAEESARQAEAAQDRAPVAERFARSLPHQED